jgi:hypothetical protein
MNTELTKNQKMQMYLAMALFALAICALEAASLISEAVGTIEINEETYAVGHAPAILVVGGGIAGIIACAIFPKPTEKSNTEDQAHNSAS